MDLTHIAGGKLIGFIGYRVWATLTCTSLFKVKHDAKYFFPSYHFSDKQSLSSQLKSLDCGFISYTLKELDFVTICCIFIPPNVIIKVSFLPFAEAFSCHSRSSVLGRVGGGWFHDTRIQLFWNFVWTLDMTLSQNVSTCKRFLKGNVLSCTIL